MNRKTSQIDSKTVWLYFKIKRNMYGFSTVVKLYNEPISLRYDQLTDSNAYLHYLDKLFCLSSFLN